MKNLILNLLLILIVLVHTAGGAIGEEAPLTLLKDPQNNTQNSTVQQQMPQLSPQQGQGQAGVAAGEQMALYDIYGVVPTKTPIPYLYIGLGLLLLLLAAALVYWLYKRKGRARSIPAIPPWERALTELQDARALLGKGQGRDYMDRASQILRHYVEDRFAIKSTRQTTREFLQSLKKSKGAEINSYKVELQQCLEQADMAKFAHKVQDDQNLMVMEQAVSTFVHATSPGPKTMGDEK